MAISHGIPSTLRRPGQFHEFDYTSSARGLVPLANRVLLIGIQSSAATATADEFQQIFSEQEADLLFGQGSEIALMARKALQTAVSIGITPEIWACGVADPAGTAAVQKFSVVAGTAATSGDIFFRVGEEVFRAGVSAGDDQDAVALSIKNAIESRLHLVPVTVTATANEVTLTHVVTGENGNDLKLFVDSVGLTAMSINTSTTTPGAGAASLTTALTNSLAKSFETIAIANHQAGDVTAMDTHMDSAWAAGEKRWRFGVMAENGTLSTANTLASTANSEKIVVVSYEDSPSTPGQIAAAMAVGISSRELPNYNYDYQELPLAIPVSSSTYSAAEIESALAAGSTPLAPNDTRSATEIVRLITTKTTENGAPFERTKDLATIRGMVFVVRQIDADFAIQFRGVNKSQRVLNRMRSRAFDKLKEMESLGIVQNVDSLFPQLLVENDPIIATRAIVSLPESIIPNLHQIVFKHVLYVE